MAFFKALVAIVAISPGLLAFATATSLPLEPRDLLNPIPANSLGDQLKWSPALDYDTDSCYNTVAISPSGQLNAGQDPNKPIGTILGFCRKEERLTKTNVYVRSRCNHGWCGYLYDYYFESDFTGVRGPAAGHRHDWEHIAVWTQGSGQDYQNYQIRFVSVSAHGLWNTRILDRGDQIHFEQGTHPKIVYHKDGGSTHAFRFADDNDEPPENHWQSWRWGGGAGLIMWEWIEWSLRVKLSQYDWGSASMAVRDKDESDWTFAWYLDQSKRYCNTEWDDCPGDLAPDFNAWQPN